MRYGFVLSEHHRYAGWSSTRKTVEVVGPLHELKARLRPWALETITNENLPDGEYYATLVEDDHGTFRFGDQLELEAIFWFYETEYVPAS